MDSIDLSSNLEKIHQTIMRQLESKSCLFEVTPFESLNFLFLGLRVPSANSGPLRMLAIITIQTSVGKNAMIIPHLNFQSSFGNEVKNLVDGFQCVTYLVVVSQRLLLYKIFDWQANKII